MTKKLKSKLIKKELDEILKSENIIDAEINDSDISENQVILWTYEKHGKDRFIICNFIEWDEQMKMWIHNIVSESEGPVVLTCPLRFLKYKNTDRFTGWRKEVRKYHNGKSPPCMSDETTLKIINEKFKQVNNKILKKLNDKFLDLKCN